MHLIDVNSDGMIELTDELYFIGQYGTSCSSNLSAAPTTDRAHQLPGEGAIDISVADHQGA